MYLYQSLKFIRKQLAKLLTKLTLAEQKFLDYLRKKYTKALDKEDSKLEARLSYIIDRRKHELNRIENACERSRRRVVANSDAKFDKISDKMEKLERLNKLDN